ncbi:PKD domain-containing protein [Candidatus Gracilibacteria bacterium]|nr:PKD domain-containing protein [Candidatus Gracilibacteria bacterium]
MFDPSKLDLDLDNSKKKNIPASKEDIKKALDKVDSPKESESTVLESGINTDTIDTSSPLKEESPEIFEEILPETNKETLIEKEILTEKTEEEVVHKTFMADDAKRDQVKAQEKIIEAEEEKKEDENIIGDISDVINNNQKLEEAEARINAKINLNADLIDINIASFQDILDILIQESYDLFILEPRDNDVKVSFRQEKVEKDVKYIKFPIYNQILLKAKSLTKLQVEETRVAQEGKGEIQVKDKKYKLMSKTVPSAFGEKILVKIVELEKKVGKQAQQKTSIGKLFGFLGIIAIIALIIGGAFIGFIVMNAKTLEDVKFFSSMGINLNDINVFISKAINTIFSILIFIETIFLSIYLFKFILTKKVYKKKKIAYAIFSFIILILTFSTGSAWMVINKKISSLPDWQEMAYGDVQIYDNSKLISEQFTKEKALLQDTSNLIGPITLKYDLTNWANKQAQQGFVIKSYIWNFGEITKNELNPVIIHKFNEKGTTKISLNVTGVNIKGEEQTKEVANIQSINISNIVDFEETVLESGGKKIRFDASDLKDLGKIEWHYDLKNLKDTSSPFVGYNYDPGQIIVEDTLIGMYIKRNGREDKALDKIFIINKSVENNIQGEIQYTQDVVDDLKYTLSVKDPDTSFGNGFIENFIWEIDDQIITKKSDLENIEESSLVEHKYTKYGEQEVTVQLEDSAGKTKTLTTVINVPKRLKLKNGLRVYNNGDLMENYRYQKSNKEYYIDELPTPTTIKFDARLIKSNNTFYSLKGASWDIDGDGKTDQVGKTLDYDVNTEGNHTIEVTYHFHHRKIEGDKINFTETIYIESIKKDSILNLVITPENNYVPTSVRFDASKSEVKGKNIEKFIYDYGDGFVEERDAINPAHKYTQAGEYNIKMRVITTDGSEYSIEKKLVLKPKPQKVKIVPSMKTAPIDQGIDFSSDESEGQIVSYFWEFGDGEVSTDANPSHSYEVAGEYNVSLKINFQNNNILKDNIEIKVVDE